MRKTVESKTNQASEAIAEDVVVTPEFEFGKWQLSDEVLQAIKAMGYVKPTPVQEAVVPFLLENQSDLLALAKTGTGKTAAFGLPLVEKLSTEKRLQALVMCPTRELASQVAQNLQAYGARKGLKVVTILGGESYRRQIDAIKLGPQILVSTPGRLIDLMEQKVIKLAGVKYFILDEADEMLSFGFQEALETTWKALAENDFNTWLFSATMSTQIKKLTSKYLKTPREVTLNTSKAEIVNIESFAAVIFEEDKEEALALLIRSEPQFYGIIFAQTKQQVANLEIRFKNMGIRVDSLHGDKVQAERTRSIQRMKKRETQILVATDVAARGLDIEDLTHVVNFELPWDTETFTHRIGRTARAGKKGTVWTFVKPKESHHLRRFEQALNFEFKPLHIPSVDKVRQKQVSDWIAKVGEVVVHPNDAALYDDTFLAMTLEAHREIVPEVRDWLKKVMVTLGVGTGKNLRQPRTLELRPRGDRAAGRPESFARNGGGDRRRSFDGPRRSSGDGGGRPIGRGSATRPYAARNAERTSDRAERPFERTERPAERAERTSDRAERPERFAERSERSARPERTERFSDRSARPERPSASSSRPAFREERSERSAGTPTRTRVARGSARDERPSFRDAAKSKSNSSYKGNPPKQR
jgi:ATP-dependent RNA helicase DeaD